MSSLEFGCLPTAIGSVPYTDPARACAEMLRYLKEIPVWPQLSRRAFRENMYVQFSEGFPGVVHTTDSVYVDRHKEDVLESLAKLYTAYDEDKRQYDIDKYPVSRNYAAGLHTFLLQTNLAPLAVKGQVTGPLTWGLTIKDETGRAIIYDDVFQDIVAMFLGLKAGWQEKQLNQISKNTIIFVDEPYMSAFGSIAVPFGKERVTKLLEKTFACIEGLKGVHCCGNTDWSVLLDTSTDIISFDAYNYAQSLSLYPAQVKAFLEKGKAIAWGIVPNEEEAIAKETVPGLRDRLEEAMAPFTRNGVRFPQLVAQGLLTPSCGLDSISEEAASRALELLAELSAEVRKRHR
jgi:methionine synthase II (cobalamin-independent)